MNDSLDTSVNTPAEILSTEAKEQRQVDTQHKKESKIIAIKCNKDSKVKEKIDKKGRTANLGSHKIIVIGI